jgi:hypothetical protein
MVDEKPLQHQLHDLAHHVMDEVDFANEHLQDAYDALLEFVDRNGEKEPGWGDILLQQAGKLQAAVTILVSTVEELHNPETWDIPAFGDESNMARA